MSKNQKHQDVRRWLIEWFGHQVAGGEVEVERHAGDNYFDRGWIDSLSVITLISALEDEFEIHFSNEEFQERSFATIDGLAEIIEKKRKKR
ncbi:MAG: hypothetical protein UY74_C0014G0019 [Candidatus Kaiserbacteria bacterium GW2011_GWC2_52_8b]|uniref:Carrier domain-containing protein n=2 Tax=Candidatus Kaiseribacteriota TaxID=1752734 RepID=A0A0G2AFY5_9BACT|nr:MAG: hypothetical protein UY67_C0006G0016 [Candidatus Kaiserbacteria bacterium GW2011_GWA2_52_12]KKW31439.1 MAG: hypothetical protein UY74_C0014G0019 [Candidatus Kaiserbacteria bacterium GW2011_GWC2_52_8b]